MSWERKADPRLIRYWEDNGLTVPQSPIIAKWVQFEPGRIWHAPTSPIIDYGVEYAVYKTSFYRVYNYNYLKKAGVYFVDEQCGIYKFAKQEHWRRAVIIYYRSK